MARKAGNALLHRTSKSAQSLTCRRLFSSSPSKAKRRPSSGTSFPPNDGDEKTARSSGVHNAANTKNDKYTGSLLLPKTLFKIQFNLKEEQEWYKNQFELHYKPQREVRGKKRFVLLDGPPFANGSLHIGTANKEVDSMCAVCVS